MSLWPHFFGPPCTVDRRHYLQIAMSRVLWQLMGFCKSIRAAYKPLEIRGAHFLIRSAQLARGTRLE